MAAARPQVLYDPERAEAEAFSSPDAMKAEEKRESV